jgi:hypothetical protein
MQTIFAFEAYIAFTATVSTAAAEVGSIVALSAGYIGGIPQSDKAGAARADE